MIVDQADTLEIRTSDDVVRVRQQVRARAIKAGLSLVDQTKLVTAASELARNTLDHARGGRVAMQMIQDGTRQGLRLVFEDQGPGIPDIQLALKDGYTTGTGLGLGLSGSRRLCNEFSLESTVGVGTKITIARWK